MLIFSEFGCRVPENGNLGIDHGTANLVFVTGKPVQGGHYGRPPDLGYLDAGDNLEFTTDFRRVYSSVIEGWLGLANSSAVLGESFATFPLFVSTNSG